MERHTWPEAHVARVFYLDGHLCVPARGMSLRIPVRLKLWHFHEVGHEMRPAVCCLLHV